MDKGYYITGFKDNIVSDFYNRRRSALQYYKISTQHENTMYVSLMKHIYYVSVIFVGRLVVAYEIITYLYTLILYNIII